MVLGLYLFASETSELESGRAGDESERSKSRCQRLKTVSERFKA